MKAGIVIDDWKLPIFRKHLTKQSFTFTVKKLKIGVKGMTLIEVDTVRLGYLKEIVEKCQLECAESRGAKL